MPVVDKNDKKGQRNSKQNATSPSNGKTNSKNPAPEPKKGKNDVKKQDVKKGGAKN